MPSAKNSKRVVAKAKTKTPAQKTSRQLDAENEKKEKEQKQKEKKQKLDDEKRKQGGKEKKRVGRKKKTQTSAAGAAVQDPTTPTEVEIKAAARAIVAQAALITGGAPTTAAGQPAGST